MESFRNPNDLREQILAIRREVGDIPEGIPSRTEISDIVSNMYAELSPEVRAHIVDAYMKTEIEAERDADLRQSLE